MGHSNVAINSTIREQCVHTKIAKVRENMKMCRTATHIKQKQTINNLILAAQECGRYGAAPLVFGVAGSTAADQQTDAQRTAPRCLRRQCRRYFGHNVRGLLLQRDQLRDRAGAPILSLPIFALVIDARHVCLGRSTLSLISSDILGRRAFVIVLSAPNGCLVFVAAFLRMFCVLPREERVVV